MFIVMNKAVASIPKDCFVFVVPATMNFSLKSALTLFLLSDLFCDFSVRNEVGLISLER